MVPSSFSSHSYSSARAAGLELDHVLRPQRADDGVVAAVGAEHDPVRRGELRDVDRVVARVPLMVIVLKFRLVAEKSPKIWTCRLAGAAGAGSTRVDADLLDVVELGDDVAFAVVPRVITISVSACRPAMPAAMAAARV